MIDTTITASIDEVVTTLLNDLSEPALVVTSSPAVISAVVWAASDHETPLLDLLASEGALQDAMVDFLIASRAADLVDDERLALRATTEASESQLIVTETSVTALAIAGDTMNTFPTEETDCVTTTNDHYTGVWNRATEFSSRMPPLSRVRETLCESFGVELANDFDAVLESCDTIPGGDGMDIVDLCLLLTARHEELLYDISKWGEDVGLASKATFSRTKNRLEGYGLIDTEKVPIDIGRPRLRLILADDRLREASAGELADIGEQIIS